MKALDALARRLRSAEDLGAIARTMKSLAAIHVRRYGRAARAIDGFSEVVELGLQAVLRGPPLAAPWAPGGPHVRAAALVLGTDQGLSGGFSDRVVRALEVWRAQRQEALAAVLVVGRRTGELLPAGVAPVVEVHPAPAALAGLPAAVEGALLQVDAWRAAGRCDELHLVRDRRGRGLGCEARVEALLPPRAEWLRALAARPWSGPSLPWTPLGRGALLADLVRLHLFATLVRAFVESLESEALSRLAAMQTAEASTERLREALLADLRRAKQDAGMAELRDILTGYEVALELAGAEGAAAAGPRAPRSSTPRGGAAERSVDP